MSENKNKYLDPAIYGTHRNPKFPRDDMLGSIAISRRDDFLSATHLLNERLEKTRLKKASAPSEDYKPPTSVLISPVTK